MTGYYVSLSGSDSNNGTSPSTPWASLSRASQQAYQPGDQVLLQGGSTFSGSLQLATGTAGAAGNPITISSYGSGTATISAGTGEAIAGQNVQYLNINNLTLVGSVENENDTSSGIDLRNESLASGAEGITISGITASNFGNSGIMLLGQFNDTSITSSTLKSNGHGGIWTSNIDWQSYLSTGDDLTPLNATDHPRSQRMVVSGVTATYNYGSATTNYSASGYGIFLANVSDAVIQSCTVTHNDQKPLSGTSQCGWSGLQVDEANNVLIQNNDSEYELVGVADGEGLVENNVVNSVIQDNYVGNNATAGILIASYPNGFGFTNNYAQGVTVRYNTVQNNLQNSAWRGASTQVNGKANYVYGELEVFNNVQSSIFYNNTIAAGFSNSHSFVGLGLKVNNQGNEVYVPFYGSNVVVSNNVLFAVGGQSGLDSAIVLPTSENFFKNTAPPKSSVNLTSEYNVVWDPYSFGSDSFLSPYFSQTPRDYSGHALPLTASGQVNYASGQINYGCNQS